jgi:DNA-binding NtrC family response regulator
VDLRVVVRDGGDSTRARSASPAQRERNEPRSPAAGGERLEAHRGADAGERSAPPRTWAELKDAKVAAQASLERSFLEAALERSHGNVSAAAQDAGLNRSVFHRLMAEHGIDAHRFRGPGPRA